MGGCAAVSRYVYIKTGIYCKTPLVNANHHHVLCACMISVNSFAGFPVESLNNTGFILVSKSPNLWKPNHLH